MGQPPDFDVEQAHKYFSGHCFNTAWGLIDKPNRTPEDEEQMIRLAHASMWHWTQRPDVSGKNLSVGYWQLSRVYAVIGETDNARKYAKLCLEKTPRDLAFYMGYAYEALARAEFFAGNIAQAKEFLLEAQRHADQVADANDKSALIQDLESLRG